MSVTAYILVKASTGEADRVRAAIDGLEGVVETSIVAGDVDFITKVVVESPAAWTSGSIDRTRHN